MAWECPEGRVCDICKQTGHLAKQCGTYQAARKEWFSSVFPTSKEKRETRQRRPRDGAEGGTRGDSADIQAGPSGIPPEHPASEAEPNGQAGDVAGAGDTATAAVNKVAGGGVSPDAADALPGEDRVGGVLCPPGGTGGRKKWRTG